MNKLAYSPALVGLRPENEFLDDYVMNTMVAIGNKDIDVPVLQGTPAKFRVIGKQRKTIKIAEQIGAQSFVDEDLLITRDLRNGVDFTAIPYKGGYILEFPNTQYFVRKAKPFEFSSIHAFMVKEDMRVYNHTFIEKKHFADWFMENDINQWRMPFSPYAVSNLTISWQMIDANGGKWECVLPSQQKPQSILRLTYFQIGDPKAASVGLRYGDQPGYDMDSHEFIIQPGCKIRQFFINTPLGAKEWGDEVELDIDTNQIKFI